MRRQLPNELNHVADASPRPARALAAALLLGFVAGYLRFCTWITHGGLANTWTANLVLLWVNAAAWRWQEAFHSAGALATER